MKVFSHHVYEYRKGLRNLILHTTLAEHRVRIEERLVKQGIDYVIYPLSNQRINVFLGAGECVDVIRRIGKPRLVDYTPEEDFMLGIMLGYDRLAQCRRYLIRCVRHAPPALPYGHQPGVWREPAPAPPARAGFTLIELLIVIGLLGAVATLLLTTLSVDRQQTLDDSIVQKELSDIQRAFQQLEADCVLQETDYEEISRYGLAALIDQDCLSREAWNADKGKGWRGPYIAEESRREIDPGADPISTAGQAPLAGGTEIPVVCTPYAEENTNDGHFYRVIPKLNDDGTIDQLWVVYPGGGGTLSGVPDPNSSKAQERKAFDQYSYKRRLLLKE